MIEPLEHRLAFADMSVVAAGGGVVVTGSDLADEITLEHRGDQIALVPGADTTLNGSAEIVLDATEAARGITFDLRAGDDRVAVSGGPHAFGISIRGGDGSDQVDVPSGFIQALDFFGDAGNDSVSIEFATIRKALRVFDSVGSTSVNLSSTRVVLGLHAELGNDSNSFRATGLSSIGNLSIVTGGKQDALRLESVIADRIALDVGGGNDRIDFGELTCRAMDINAGSGIDEVNVVGANIARRLRVSMGGGRDLLRVDRSTILGGMDFADSTAGRFYLSGARLAGAPSVFTSNSRQTLLATNSRFSEVQLAFRGEGSTATFVSSPLNTLRSLPGNMSAIERT